MTDPPTKVPPRPRGGAWLLLPALLLVLGGAWAWREWQAREAAARAAATDGQRLSAIESRLEGLRRDQRAQAQRLQHADATNRLLREELLGLAQRAALLEESVGRLADGERTGVQALRLDEAELLLSQAAQRLSLAGDLDGARRAYALAAGLLQAIDDPAWLDLRQTLAQERAAVDALGEDPRARASAQLDAFAAMLADLPARADHEPEGHAPWWRRLFSRVVQVRPATGAPLAAADREAGMATLHLDLALARAALAAGDDAGFDAALARIQAWLPRAWPPSPARDRARGALRDLADMPLRPDLPVLGSTLEQLRRMRAP